MIRRSAAAALLLVGSAALSGCGGSSQPVDLDAAIAHYGSGSSDLVEAFQDAYPAVSWDTSGTTRPSDASGSCRLHVATWASDPSLVESAGDWNAVRDLAADVLQSHGFGDLSQPEDRAGGWQVASSTDGSGAVVELSDKGETKVQLRVPLPDDEC
jgi:predicted lipoprotein